MMQSKMLLSQQIVPHTASKVSFPRRRQPCVGLIYILSCINHRFWLQNPLFWYSGTDPILYTILYLALIRNILKTKCINRAHLNIRRGIALTRRPTSDEHPEMLWKENSKGRSEETCLGYKRLPAYPQHLKGESVCAGKGRVICFPYREAAYERRWYSYCHSDLFLKKGKTNCKGVTKKKRELINHTAKQVYALQFK